MIGRIGRHVGRSLMNMSLSLLNAAQARDILLVISHAWLSLKILITSPRYVYFSTNSTTLLLIFICSLGALIISFVFRQLMFQPTLEQTVLAASTIFHLTQVLCHYLLYTKGLVFFKGEKKLTLSSE